MTWMPKDEVLDDANGPVPRIIYDGCTSLNATNGAPRVHQLVAPCKGHDRRRKTYCAHFPLKLTFSFASFQLSSSRECNHARITHAPQNRLVREQ